ncbi:MAG: AAA family ATPase, partial [Clostridiaceae bacterium]|nr:AAA family ATPase [Clostridiaceae bacterium]
MRIVTAHIYGYGKFINKTFNFNQGMNAVIGYNETGKSTLMSFVKSMLYGHKKNEREGKDGSLPEVKKYKPWNTDKYGGYLIVHTDDGRLLRIERDFNSKSLTVYNENNEDITSEFSFSKESGMLGQDLLGMDLECFMNSAFVCQDKSILYPEDKENIAQKLMNISESAEEDVSVADSIKILKDGKTFLGNERTSKRRYNNLISNIRTEKEELLKMQTENENCIEYLEEANVLKDEIKQLELEEKLCVKKQVYEEVIKDIEKYEKNKYEADSLKEGLSVIDIEEYEKSKELLDEEIKAVNFNEEDKDNLYKNIKINNSIITLLIIIGVLILTAGIILSIIVDMWFLLLALITAGCGIGLFLLLKKNKENQNIIEKIDEIIHKEDSLQKTKTKIEENKSKEDLIKRYERLMIDILINQDVADFDALKEKAEVFSPKKTYPQISHDECVRQIQRKRERLAVVNAQIDKYLKSDDQIASQQ